MRREIIRPVRVTGLCILALGIVCGLWRDSGAEAPRRVALVIGNGAYASAPLVNPPHDAQDMAQALRTLGFEVIHRIDADRRSMFEAMDAFYSALRGAELGLFFFAGHGMQIGGENYLIPVNAHVVSESDVRWEALPAGRVVGRMKDGGAGLNIVVLDACRDNPFKRSFRTGTRGLAQMDAPKGTIIAYATSPGSVASDGSGRNGVFTKHLLEKLKEPGLSIQDVFLEAGLDVMEETMEAQVPWTSQTPVPRYYLAGKGGALPLTVGAKGRETPLGTDAEQLKEERRRLERLKVDLEQKQRQMEATKTANLSKDSIKVSKTLPSPDVVEQDGRFVLFSTGVVWDTETGLEWMAGPDEHTSLEKAKEWINEMAGGAEGWRFASVEELMSLYHPGLGTRNMTPLLKTSGWSLWSTATSVHQQYVDFQTGETGLYSLIDGPGETPKRGNLHKPRALAVRDRQ